VGIYDVTKRSFTSTSFSLFTPFDELTISTGQNIVEKLLGENKLNLNSYFPIVVHHHCCPFMLVLFFFPVGQKKSMCKCGRKRDFGTTTRREKKVCKNCFPRQPHKRVAKRFDRHIARRWYISTLGVLVGNTQIKCIKKENRPKDVQTKRKAFF
jgi:hypothetical protein